MRFILQDATQVARVTRVRVRRKMVAVVAVVLSVAAIGVGFSSPAVAATDLQVTSWGGNLWGVISTTPGGLTDVTAIAASERTNLALKSDGEVIGWGENYYGATTPPEGLTHVVAIAAGDCHSVALKSDGTVVAWGANFFGQTNVPVGLSDVVAISAGAYHTLALKKDGTVAAWGYDSNGQAEVPVGLSGVVAISAGPTYNLALKSDGTVVAWGYASGAEDVPDGLSGVTAIAAGDYHSLALKSDGTVVAWGADWRGQVDVPEGLSGVTAIDAGAMYSLALKRDGTAVAWGTYYDGNNELPMNVPSDLARRVIAFAAGGDHVLALVTNTPADVTPPTVTGAADRPPNSAGWYRAPVRVSWTATDETDGLLTPPPTVVISTEGAGQTAESAPVCDEANNCATGKLGGINIDTTPPVLTWNSPGPDDGAAYDFGTVPAASTCLATDKTSGVTDAGCLVTGYSAGVGTHTLTATATDNAGNTTSQSRTYTVRAWTLAGFYAPVNMDGVWNTVKGGSTVPLKFEVSRGGTELTDTSAVQRFTQTRISCSTGAGEDPVEITTTGGTTLRYDGGQFIQNWQTPKSPGTCYQVTVTTRDNSTLTALFKLK